MIKRFRPLLQQLRDDYVIHNQWEEKLHTKYLSIGANLNSIYSIIRHLVEIQACDVLKLGNDIFSQMMPTVENATLTNSTDDNPQLLLQRLETIRQFLTSDNQVALDESAMAGWDVLTGHFRIIVTMLPDLLTSTNIPRDLSEVMANVEPYIYGMSNCTDEVEETTIYLRQKCLETFFEEWVNQFEIMRMVAICGIENGMKPCQQWINITAKSSISIPAISSGVYSKHEESPLICAIRTILLIWILH